VDLGLALLQTVAENSAEACRRGVELHGPARSVMVHANPAALKHLLDLLVEHAMQQGRVVRLEIDGPAAAAAPARQAPLHDSRHESARGPALDAEPMALTLRVQVSSEPSACPPRDTLAWLLLRWLAGALGLRVVRQAVERGEWLELSLRRTATVASPAEI
jgi:hypothetical protein